MKLWTIGHSTRPVEPFLSLLRRERIEKVADVRRVPASRRYPHFSRDALATTLSAAGIGYSHHPSLGGRRISRSDSPHQAWRNASFRGYADYMDTAEFREALSALTASAMRKAVAIMCAEAVPWRCHRSLIADALVAGGAEVEHILDQGTRLHVLTRFAVVRQGRVAYPAPTDDPSGQGNMFSV